MKAKVLRSFLGIVLSGISIFWICPGFSQTKTLKYDTPISSNCNGYYEYLPKDYFNQPTKNFPLIIYFHGLGVIGNGSKGQLEYVVTSGWGTPPWRTWNTTTFPTSFNVNGTQTEFILITPQFKVEPNIWDADNVIEYCLKNYRVDPHKVYLAGQSSGGGLVVSYASYSLTFAKKLAGVLASSPAAGATQAAGNIISSAHLPLWLAASQYDEIDGSSNFMNLAKGWVNAVTNATPKPVYIPLLSILPGTHGHNDAAIYLYDPATKLNGKNAYEWVLQFDNQGTVPVTDLQLSSKVNETTVSLFWSTQSERNNRGFRIERSKDGQNFAEIGFKDAKGNENGASYTYTDLHPYNGQSFYRLAQEDLDGRINYSKTIAVSIEQKQAIVVYPNPVVNKLNLQFKENFRKIQVQVFDNSGRLVKGIRFENSSGLSIVVDDLTSGSYNGKVIADGKTFTFKFLKQQ